MSKVNNNKDIANSLNKYVDSGNKGVNLGLDMATQLNKLYEDNLNKVSNRNSNDSRLSTNVDNKMTETNTNENKVSSKLATNVSR